MYTISTLLFLVARRPSRIHIVSYYFSSIIELLLILSTMRKSPLHGPCNDVDGTWGRSANCCARTSVLTFAPNQKSLTPNNIVLGVNSTKTSKLLFNSFSRAESGTKTYYSENFGEKRCFRAKSSVSCLEYWISLMLIKAYEFRVILCCCYFASCTGFFNVVGMNVVSTGAYSLHYNVDFWIFTISIFLLLIQEEVASHPVHPTPYLIHPLYQLLRTRWSTSGHWEL